MKKEVYEVVLTFNISINRDGVVAFVVPTQDKTLIIYEVQD